MGSDGLPATFLQGDAPESGPSQGLDPSLGADFIRRWNRVVAAHLPFAPFPRKGFPFGECLATTGGAVVEGRWQRSPSWNWRVVCEGEIGIPSSWRDRDWCRTGGKETCIVLGCGLGKVMQRGRIFGYFRMSGHAGSFANQRAGFVKQIWGSQRAREPVPEDDVRRFGCTR